MKLPKTKNSVFLIVMSLYALLIVAVSFLGDYRFAVGTFMILTSVSFAIALWAWLRTTKLVTVLLAATLALMPVRAADTENQPQDKDAVAIACAVIIVGGVIIWGIWKICQKLPSPPKPVPPPPKPGPRGTNANHAASAFLSNPARLDLPEADVCDSAEWQMQVMIFQSSTNSITWTDEYTVTNWLSLDTLVSVCASNGVPLLTNFVAVCWTNDVIVSDLSSVMPAVETAPARMWRAAQR